MYGMYFSFVLFCIAIYCNLLWWRDYYYHFFTYIHVLFSINVFKRKKNVKRTAGHRYNLCSGDHITTLVFVKPVTNVVADHHYTIWLMCKP